MSLPRDIVRDWRASSLSEHGVPLLVSCPGCGSTLLGRITGGPVNIFDIGIRYNCSCGVTVSTSVPVDSVPVVITTSVSISRHISSRIFTSSRISKSFSDKVVELQKEVPFSYIDLHMSAAVLSDKRFFLLENLCKEAQEKGIAEVHPMAINMAALIQRLEEA